MGKRGRKGKVSIIVNECGSRTLRYTFKGNRYQETVNESQATIRATEIELEIQKGDHVPRKLQKRKEELTLTQAWSEFLILKERTTKPKTFKDTYGPINSWVQKCPYKTLDEAPKAIRWYEEHCTPGMCKRVLMRLSACCAAYCDRNPFEGEYKRFKDKYEYGTNPRMLTEGEIEAGLEAMNERARGLTRFMLLTGCRPGEALGLHHEDIQGSVIHFHQQCLEASGRVYLQEGLKTQKERYFPVNDELRGLLDSLKGEGLIFTLKPGNFRHYWKKHFPQDTTPYNCRDTFITQQLIKGVSSEVIAAWVGNSAQIINKHYLDKVKLGLSQLPK